MPAKLSERCSKNGIELSGLVEFAKYLNDGNTFKLLKRFSHASIDPELIEKLFPLLDIPSRDVILQKILDGEMDWHILVSTMQRIEMITDFLLLFAKVSVHTLYVIQIVLAKCLKQKVLFHVDDL